MTHPLLVMMHNLSSSVEARAINDAELFSKNLSFVAIPLNLALLRCESWALKNSLVDSISALMRRRIRRILGINMLDVRENTSKMRTFEEDSMTCLLPKNLSLCDS